MVIPFHLNVKHPEYGTHKKIDPVSSISNGFPVCDIRAKGLFPCLVVHKRSHILFTEEVTQAWIDPSKKVISHEIPFYQAVSNSIQ